MTKEELRKKLNEIEETEHNELIDANYPKFEKLIGKCFKYKNSYSCPDTENDYWYIYTKVTSIEKSDLYVSGENVLSNFKGVSFQKCKYGIITIESNKSTYVHCIGEEIPEEEYDKAKRALKNELYQIL